MRLFIAILITCLFSWPVSALADTVYLTNGHKIHGKTSEHPVFEKTHTIVTFSNGGHVTLKNSEIERILPDNTDQFEMRVKTEGLKKR